MKCDEDHLGKYAAEWLDWPSRWQLDLFEMYNQRSSGVSALEIFQKVRKLMNEGFHPEDEGHLCDVLH
jgi:DUF438 domain-containing protein